MKVTTRGRVTIPKSLRDEVDLRGGSEVDFEYIGDGKAIVRQAATPRSGLKRSSKRLASI